MPVGIVEESSYLPRAPHPFCVITIPDGALRYELVPEPPVRRGTATINVSWADKEVFDAIQWWLSHQRGRPVTQWDVFSFLLGIALEGKDSPLAHVHLFPSE